MKAGVSFMSYRFGRYAVLRVYMTHAQMSRTLLPLPLYASLRLYHSAMDSAVTIYYLASESR